jgi:ABC-type multidrug transport system ATPase subunit
LYDAWVATGAISAFTDIDTVVVHQQVLRKAEEPPAVGLGLGCLLVLPVMYVVLVWYISQVRGSDDEAPQHMFFPLDPSYYGLSSRAAVMGGGDVPAKDEDLEDGGGTLARERTKSGADGTLRVHKLSKSYQDCQALREVSLTMAKDEIFVLLGQNGAGKSTLISVLTGRTGPTFGHAFAFGLSLRGQMRVIQRLTSVCPQEDLIWPELTGEEHVLLYSMCRGASWAEARQEAAEVLARVGLASVGSQQAAQYSGGMQRRLMVGLAIVSNPKLLFFDEPSRGLDPLSRHVLWQILESLKPGRVICLTTHNLEEAESLGDSVGLLHNGHLRATGTPVSLKERFGRGFQISLSPEEAARSKVYAAVAEHLKGAMVDDRAVPFTVVVPRGKRWVSKVVAFFEWLESSPQVASRCQVGFSNGTLEEVYLRMLRFDNATLATSPDAALDMFKEKSPKEQMGLILSLLHMPADYVDTLDSAGITLDTIVRSGIHSVAPQLQADGGPLSEAAKGDAEEEDEAEQNGASTGGGAAALLDAAAVGPPAHAGASEDAPSSGASLPPPQPREAPVWPQVCAMALKNLTVDSQGGCCWFSCKVAQMLVLVLLNLASRVTPADMADLETYLAFKAMLLVYATWLFFPSVVDRLFVDRSNSLVHMYSLLGLRHVAYWAGMILYDLTICLVLVLTYFAVGWSSGQAVYTDVGWIAWALLLPGGALAQVAVAVVLSAVMPSSRIAPFVTMSVLAISPLALAIVQTSIAMTKEGFPEYLLVYPMFAYGQAALLCMQSHAQEVSLGTSLLTSLAYLWIGSLVWGAVGIYLHLVLPTQRGVPASPLLCLSGPAQRFCGLFRRQGNLECSDDCESVVPLLEDEDLLEERRLIRAGELPAGTAIVVAGATKRYGESGYGLGDAKLHTACSDIYLHMRYGDSVAVLGPNGAGKTTLMNMITTTIVPSEGRITVAGCDIAEEPDTCRRCIGMCPQHDVLAPNLSVKDHFLFAARAQGLPWAAQGPSAQKIAEQVELDGDPFEKHAANLSGGQRRRLTIALAAFGSPPAMVFDEPTNGLDPGNRQRVWEFIKHARKDRLCLLTTQSMEEAEVLSNRITMMAGGTLRCLGSPLHLKSKFGQALRLKIALGERSAQIDDLIRERICKEARHERGVGALRVYRLPRAAAKVSQAFAALQALQDQGVIRGWELSVTSLEDVFMRIVGERE